MSSYQPPSVAATVVGEYHTGREAYAALDAMAERMAATGVSPDVVQLFVVDDTRRPVPRRSPG